MNTIATLGNTRHVATLLGRPQKVSRYTMFSREFAELDIGAAL